MDQTDTEDFSICPACEWEAVVRVVADLPRAYVLVPARVVGLAKWTADLWHFVSYVQYTREKCCIWDNIDFADFDLKVRMESYRQHGGISKSKSTKYIQGGPCTWGQGFIDM